MAGYGLDCGTYNLICARRGEDKNEIKYRKEVNAFLDVQLEQRHAFNMLKASGVPLIEREKVAYIVGDAAVNFAYAMPQLSLKRPMKDGCLNPVEKDAFRILSIMMHSLIGEVDKDKDVLYYSVPANAVNQTTDADYHQKVLESILKAYKVNGKTITPYAINEGLALVYAELGHKAFTGIGVSCLCPGTKIYTDKGIVNIENVRIGDKVIGNQGTWDTVYNIITKPFVGRSTTISINGSDKQCTNYTFVDNHKLYVKRKGTWVWAGCETIEVGEIVGEPIIKQNLNMAMPKMVLIERITCSKLRQVNHIEVTPDLCKLIGLFLGDGSINNKEVCIQFDFANHEEDNILDVEKLIKKLFDKETTRTIKSENCTRVKCYSKSLLRWFKENCYRDGNKHSPFSLEELDDNCCHQMLVGLLNSDGRISSKSVYFYNTNSKLIHLARQLFARCGIGASVHCRQPRQGGKLKTGRTIVGRKIEYAVGSGSLLLVNAFPEYEFNFANNKLKNKIWIEDGFICSRVKTVKYNKYEGMVYDLQVAGSRSFSGPGLTISNCGAGMVNFCYSIFSHPVFNFSIVNSGDWIDEQAAKSAGETPTTINKLKQKIDLTKMPTNVIERAIQGQYRIMIERTMTEIKKAILDAGNSVRVENPIDIILGGGTASPPGFVEIVQEVVKGMDFPIPIGEIKKPQDHLFAVARGCLIAAENAQ